MEIMLFLKHLSQSLKMTETIIGDTSKSSAKIIVDDYDNNKKLYITSQQRFDIGEKVID